MLYKTIGPLLFFFMFAPQFCPAQTTKQLMRRDGFHFYKEAMVSTKDSSVLNSDTRIVILKETAQFILFAGYDIFQDNLENFIQEYNISWDKELLKQFQQQNGAVLSADKIAQTPLAKMRINYRTAGLLQKGDCLVYNKRSKKLERNIIIKWFHTGKKCVAEGEIFYFHNTEILVAEGGAG